MLGDLEHQAVAAIVGLQRVQDRRQVFVEGDVDDGADDLADLARRAGAEFDRRRLLRCFGRGSLGGRLLLGGSGSRSRRSSSGSLLSPSVLTLLPFVSSASPPASRHSAPRAPRRPK